MTEMEADPDQSVLDHIWACMNSLVAQNEVHEEDGPTCDVCVDPTHKCTDNCEFVLREMHTYVCKSSSNVHYCGNRCTKVVDNGEEMVCPLTALCVSKIYRQSFKSTDPEHGGHKVQSVTDGFEIVKTKRSELMPQPRVKLKKLHRTLHQDDAHKVAQSVVNRLLWSDKRTALQRDIHRRKSKSAYKKVHSYLRYRLKNVMPIVLTDIQSIFITEMQRSDAWSMKSPPYNAARLDYLSSQCTRMQRIMDDAVVRACIQSPLFQLSKRTQVEYYALAMLYIMRDGVSSDTDECVVGRDMYLNKYLPNLNGLQHFGFKKSRFTHASSCLKMALCLQKKFKISA
ncbi:hypothetical protein CYMTET_2717 [Cymbomonas tetramitiformis]|uniref:Uncharacterized protein n=1 Tax=Cymbomonas tetramitiformis TaxID=36881 RepID=A0AAE0H4P4_9CHLO|nr:hypothetical protein CYMTET_2717 [Cymbomonas tetramitiformis]